MKSRTIKIGLANDVFKHYYIDFKDDFTAYIVYTKISCIPGLFLNEFVVLGK